MGQQIINQIMNHIGLHIQCKNALLSCCLDADKLAKLMLDKCCVNACNWLVAEYCRAACRSASFWRASAIASSFAAGKDFQKRLDQVSMRCHASVPNQGPQDR